MSSTMFWSWTVMLKSNGDWMPPGKTWARAVCADPPIWTGNWYVWQYWVRGTPIVDRPVWLTSEPIRLLASRYTVDAADPVIVDRGVVPATPRVTVTVVAAVGSPLICMISLAPVLLLAT